MGRKTGDRMQILIRLDKEPELWKQFEVIRQDSGIRSNIEIIRMLINDKYKEICRRKEQQK